MARAAEGARTEPAGFAEFRYGLNTSTICNEFQRPIVEMLEIASKAGYQDVEPWIRDIDRYVSDGGSLGELHKRIEDLGLGIPSAIAFAEWAVDENERREKGLEEAKRSMEIVQRIGGRQIAAPPAGITDRPETDYRKLGERYAKLIEVGRSIGVTPMVEVWGFSKTIGRLSEAVAVAIESGQAEACVLADAYHMYKGGSNPEGLRQVAGRTMFAFHMNDYPADPPRDRITDADRVLPGDGVAPLGRILGFLAAGGFRGTLSLELFNRERWNKDPLAVAREGLEKMKRLTPQSVS
jgi:sugar phosphate isomerase/epimerase